MKRIKLATLAVAAVCALSGSMAPSSQAVVCLHTAENNTGTHTNPICTEMAVGLEKNFVRIQNLVSREGVTNIWCAETAVENTGNWSNALCTTKGASNNFIRVALAGPFWHVNGSKLSQGSKGVKLQNKGPLSLSAEVIAKPENISFTVTCKNSTSNGTVDGQGAAKQGQGKGSVTYEQCKVEDKASLACKVAEPIKTNQLKAHLAYAAVKGDEQIVELYEPAPSPQTGEKIFTTLILSSTSGSSCTAIAGSYKIHGAVVGQIMSQEGEAHEGLVSFPEQPITLVVHEGEAVEAGLFAGTVPAKFIGSYGARLQNGEPFGAFSS